MGAGSLIGLLCLIFVVSRGLRCYVLGWYSCPIGVMGLWVGLNVSKFCVLGCCASMRCMSEAGKNSRTVISIRHFNCNS